MLRPAQYTNAYFQQLLTAISITASVMPFAVIALGFLVRQGVLDNRFYAGDLMYGLISFGFILAALCNVYLIIVRKGPSPTDYLFLSVVYHALSIFFLLFVSGINGPFTVGWIFLLIATDTYFGTRSTIISLSILVLTTLAWFQLYPGLGATERLGAIALIFFIVGIGFVASMLRGITDKERADLEKTRTKVNFQRQRLLALVNSMGDAVVATTEDGKIVLYNAATLSVLDTNADLTNKNIDTVVKFRDTKSRRMSMVEEAKKTHQVASRTDITRKISTDEIQHLYVNVAPVRPSYRTEGERGYIFVLRDITKEKTLEQERDEFVSVVSHELRTPIAIAEGNLSNMKLMQQRGADPKIFTQAIDESHEQILYLAKLVNDLGTLSRAERGVGAEAEHVNVNDLLKEIFNDYTPQAAAKKLHLNIDLAPNLPTIETSRLYLQEILQNLITNAIKYTPSGSVTVSAKPQQRTVVVSVKDTGIGISKADQAHMFEKFYRSEDFRTRETSGTGLGLYVCKKLAEKLGCSITFASRLNHGSEFVLTIPAGQTAPPKAPLQ